MAYKRSQGPIVKEVRAVVGTTPAVGVEISETVPTGVVWKILSCTFRLVTSAVAGNRVVGVIYEDAGAVPLMEGNAATNQVAVRTRDYIVSAFGQNIATEASTIDVSIGPDISLSEGMRIRTETVALDAGDQFSNVRILVEESKL